MLAMSLSSPLPILSVHPSRALVDEKFEVIVENLSPGCPVTIRSLHHSEDGDDWEAYGLYVSDHTGRVSVSQDMSFGGTYSGRESMGLIWSMRPVPGSRTGLRLRKKDITTPMLVSISLYSGHEDFRDKSPLASMVTERWYMGPGVQRIKITEGGLRGSLFIPPGPGPYPGMLDLWGAGGGLVEYRSALLASHGYVCLALEYFKMGHMKSTDMSFDYFVKAYHVLKGHPQVIPDKVGIIGMCLGTVVTLNLVAENTEIKPSCVVCISNVISKSPGNSLSGFQQSIPSEFNKIRLDENNYQIWKDVGLAVLKEPSMKVNVAKINCPLLLVNGCDDQNWCAVETADDISNTMNAAGKGHLVTRLDYADTGHLIEPPFLPHCAAGNVILHSSNEKVIQAYGGKTKPHSHAQEDSWTKILSFLQHHLYCRPTAKL